MSVSSCMIYEASKVSAALAGGFMAFWYAFLDFHEGLTLLILISSTFLFVVGAKQVVEFWRKDGGWNDILSMPIEKADIKKFHVPALIRFGIFLLSLVIIGSFIRFVANL